MAFIHIKCITIKFIRGVPLRFHIEKVMAPISFIFPTPKVLNEKIITLAYF